MSWLLVSKIAALAVLATFLLVLAHGAIIDKNREDALKRKQAGLL